MNRDTLRALLIRHEGVRLKGYKDTSGLTTIGVGRCVDTTGVSEAEAMYLLENDMSRVVSFCREAYPWFNGMDDARQNVICSLVFNLGAAGFSQFKKTLAAIAAKDYATAANELMLSVWASQVGQRAVDLATMLRDGDPRH